jgi:hypothetical protein
MIPAVPDEKIGPFLVRARNTKAGFVSIVIEGDKIVRRFEGEATEAGALDVARAYAREQTALRRPPPRGGARRPRAAPEASRTLDDLRGKFLRHFPKGFADPDYLKQERDYKEQARRALLAAVDLDGALFADPAACAAAKAALSTNMLTRFENARVRAVLDGAEGPAFLRGAAQLARGDAAAGLAAIEASVRPHGSPSWTIATYLPFLWAPDTHALLRITATQRVAAWLGHPFVAVYEPALKPEVHAAFMGFMATIRDDLADLAPRDMIDVQSFVWVAAEYD